MSKIKVASPNNVIRLMSKSERIKFILGISVRVFANFIDLIALAGVGILALLASQLVSNSGNESLGHTVSLPIIGKLSIPDSSVSLIAFVVAFLFITKSLISIRLNNSIGKIIAQSESNAANQLLNYMFGNRESNKAFGSVSDLQNVLTKSLSALFGAMLTSYVTLIAEGTLLLILIAGFVFVSPLATILLILYLGAILFGLNLFVSKRIKVEASIGVLSDRETLQGTRDLFSIFKETELIGSTQEWVKAVSSAKHRSSMSAVRYMNLNGVPRYVIESSLVVGIFIFISVSSIFGTLASQAVILGVFLTGGLRLIASTLPLQSAINTFRHSEKAGQSAYEILLSIPDRTKVTREKAKPKSIFSSSGVHVIAEHVHFFFDSGQEVITDFQVDIPAGSKCALVGPSGAGKSTIFNLLLGFLKPTSGRVSLDSMDPQDFIIQNPGEVGFVPQKPQLISGTLRQNILLDLESDFNWETQLQEALVLAGLTDVVGKLPQGLESLLEPDTVSLSGGEIQRIGLARAILRKPRLLFLDEATSALDAQTEDKVITSLHSLSSSTTTVVIAHRLSTVKDADLILYIDEGKLVASGNFSELREKVPNFEKAIKLMMLE